MLKTIARKVLGEDDWAILSWCRSRFGLYSALSTYWSMHVSDGVYGVPNTLTGDPIFLRRHSNDQEVFDKIFVAKEYDLDLDHPLFIVDAGAYTGLSSAFFASKYPDATVIAIEPEPSNFKMLLLNTTRHAHVKPIEAGLWSHKTFLRVQDAHASTWGYRVMEDPSGVGIEAIGIPDIMSRFGAARIDVLKIDIEGSEVEVLNQCASWIDSVRVMIIELHDWFRPGCSSALERALSGSSYRKSFSGESVIVAKS